MKEFSFTLIYELPDPCNDPDQYIDVLYEAGCGDASLGIGQRGRIGLDFIRESHSVEDAIQSAIENVKSAIPQAKLIEVNLK